MIWENHDFSVIVMWFNFVLFDDYLCNHRFDSMFVDVELAHAHLWF